MELIRGGNIKSFNHKNTRIVVSDSSQKPFPVDIMIYEEDTNLVLTLDKVMIYQEEHPIRVMTKIMESQPQQPGSLVTNGQSWYAVTIDVDQLPMCQPQWVSDVYGKLFEKIKREKIVSAGIHILGSTHGNIPIEQAVILFLERLQCADQTCLKYIWFIVSQEKLQTARKRIREYLQ